MIYVIPVVMSAWRSYLETSA